MQPVETLILKAAALARISPQQWQEFLEALDGYTKTHHDALVSSTLTELPVKQGQVQSLVLLQKHLANWKTSADKITQKEARK